jgi:hypothetical protein
MSHFTVLVVGDDVESQLMPYDENAAGGEYSEFVSLEEEYLNEYENGTLEQIKMPDGTLFYTWDKKFVSPSDTMSFKNEYVYPEGSQKVEVPFKEMFSTFEIFASDYHGHREGRDPEKGEYGYWRNPNAKWDWYEVGGRWTGFFRMKPGCSGELGEPGIQKILDPNYESPAANEYADSALKGHIDFEQMIKEEVDRNLETYRKFHSIVKKRTVPVWKEVLAESATLAEAREIYYTHPVIVELTAEGFWDDPSEYNCSEDAYIKYAASTALSTHALVKDGKWYENGSMGWWGIVSDAEDPIEWSQMWKEMVLSLPDDTLLTLVDCHI